MQSVKVLFVELACAFLLVLNLLLTLIQVHYLLSSCCFLGLFVVANS